MSDDLAMARAIVARFDPVLPAQMTARTAILEFVDAHPDALVRSCHDGHLTGSALVVSSDRRHALLMHHRKLGLWLQMGGHADGNGDLAEVAAAEAAEESGIDGLVLSSRPVDVDIHLVEPPGEQPHLHLDVRWVAVAPPGAVEVANHESLELRWFTLEEIASLGVDPSTLRLASLVLGTHSAAGGH